MTLLVTSILAKSVAELKTAAGLAWSGGTDAIEVRIDGFNDDLHKLAKFLASHGDRTWIVTCRSRAEGGLSGRSGADRYQRIEAATVGTNAIVDVEFSDRADSESLRDHEEVEEVTPENQTPDPPRTNRRMILSAHDIETGGSSRVAALLEHMKNSSKSSIGKLAYAASGVDESFAAMDIMREHGSSAIAIAMGESGMWTRVLARKLGAFASFCALDRGHLTAPGQLTLSEMRERYRWDRINENTMVYGVIGDPVAHSMSPLIFNRWFDEAEINAVYLPIRVDDGEDGLRRFFIEARKRPWLDLGGFSVTIPHKTTAVELAGEGADWMAKRIGAANTLCLRDGALSAYNTDCYASVNSLCAALGGDTRTLAGLPVDVLGTGGAARALLYGLGMSGCDVTLYGRSPEKTSELADRYLVRSEAWDARTDGKGKVLVNCTSVGMWPELAVSPIPPSCLGRYELVMDLIYNPLETQLLRDAAEAGVRTLNGLDMFVRQAAMQLALWTGKSANAAAAAEWIRQELADRDNATQ